MQGTQPVISLNQALVLFLVAIVVNLWFIMHPQDRLTEKSKHLEIPTKESVGYAAPESEIVTGRIYYCDASLWEIQFDPRGKALRTNYSAILQENRITSSNFWLLVGDKRFFQISNPIRATRERYVAERVGSNLTFRVVRAGSQL